MSLKNSSQSEKRVDKRVELIEGTVLKIKRDTKALNAIVNNQNVRPDSLNTNVLQIVAGRPGKSEEIQLKGDRDHPLTQLKKLFCQIGRKGQSNSRTIQDRWQRELTSLANLTTFIICKSELFSLIYPQKLLTCTLAFLKFDYRFAEFSFQRFCEGD